MPSNYLEDMFLRAMAMQRECVPETQGTVPYFFHTQETFPYWTNRVTSAPAEFYTEDLRRHTYTLVMRLVVGHLTEGQPGAPDSLLYSYLGTIDPLFDARIGLTSADYPNFPDYFDAVNAEYQGALRIGVFDNRSIGIPTPQIGVEFHHLIPFLLPVTYPVWR